MASLKTETKNSMASFERAYRKLLEERPGALASESGGELEWMINARDRDAARWSAEGLPTRRDERWKYTSLSSLAQAEIEVPKWRSPSELKAVAGIPEIKTKVAARLVFVDGQFAPQLSDLGSIAGLSVSVLSKLFEESVENGWSDQRLMKFAAMREHVQSTDADRETVFAAMNTSFTQDAVLINVEKSVVVRDPIVVIYHSTVGQAEATLPMISPRVFAHLQANSEAALFEIYSGDESKRYFINAVTDVRLEDSARLSQARAQIEGLGATHIATTRVHQKSSSFCETYQFSFGGQLSRQDLHITLEGQGAETVLDGLYFVEGRQHADHHTSVDHAVPHTTSSQLYKGVLSGEARAVFNGRVLIARDAQKSNAAQLNNNLILSSKAEVDTKPELEIDADDVKASHGATIGQIDPEHVFYLQTRGMSREQAVRILARGFAEDVVFRIRNEGLRKIAHEILDRRIDALKVENA